MNNRAEILNFLKQNRDFLSDTYHLSKIGLFGSFAREEQKTNSDVDDNAPKNLNNFLT